MGIAGLGDRALSPRQPARVFRWNEPHERHHARRGGKPPRIPGTGRGVAMLTVAPHPRLDLCAFTTAFPAALSDVPSPIWLTGLLAPGADAPLGRSEDVRRAVRDLLRHGGYKPTGRGKPASEYLVRAANDGNLISINAAVDACNVASLHSGLPISVVDLDLAVPPFRVALRPMANTMRSTLRGRRSMFPGFCACTMRKGRAPTPSVTRSAQKPGQKLGARWRSCGVPSRLPAGRSRQPRGIGSCSSGSAPRRRRRRRHDTQGCVQKEPLDRVCW